MRERKTGPVSTVTSPIILSAPFANLTADDTRPVPRGAVAHLGERLLCKQEVRGSSPLSSTNLVLIPSHPDVHRQRKFPRMVSVLSNLQKRVPPLTVLTGLLAMLTVVTSVTWSACADEPQIEKPVQNAQSPTTMPAGMPTSVPLEGIPTQGTDRFVAISVGHEHNCALQADGGVVCWGNDHLPLPSSRPDEKFIAISAGNNFTCALKEDGAPVCWGLNWIDKEELSPPPGEKFVAISAGNSHACALREDGTPICWGANWGGQTEAPSDKKFISITSSFDYSCGIDNDTVAMCWGNVAEHYQSLGRGFASISGGYAATCGLKENENVVCWRSSGGHIDVPPQDLRYFGSHISSAVANRRCGIQYDGSAFCWSYSVGFDFTIESPPSDEKFLEIGTGKRHICGLLVDGSIKCWGDNYSGQITPPPTIAASPLVPSFSEICAPGNTLPKRAGCRVPKGSHMEDDYTFVVTDSGQGILYEGDRLLETRYGKIDRTWLVINGYEKFTSLSAHANTDGSWTIDTVLEWE